MLHAGSTLSYQCHKIYTFLIWVSGLKANKKDNELLEIYVVCFQVYQLSLPKIPYIHVHLSDFTVSSRLQFANFWDFEALTNDGLSSVRQ